MLKVPRFSKAAFIKHFMSWIRENGTPGGWYLVFRGQPVTLDLLYEVADFGYPRGPWLLTIEEVFKNYHQAMRQQI